MESSNAKNIKNKHAQESGQFVYCVNQNSRCTGSKICVAHLLPHKIKRAKNGECENGGKLLRLVADAIFFRILRNLKTFLQ